MTRLRTILALLVASLLLLSACSTTSAVGTPAATVNDEEITDDEFRDMLETLAEHRTFARLYYGVEPGEDEGRVTSEFAAAVLELEVLLTLVDQEFDERDLELDAAAVEEARQSFLAGLEQARTSVGPEESTALDDLPQSLVDGIAAWNAQVAILADALVAEGGPDDEITEADVEAFYEENQAAFTEVCAHHVLVETEDEAEEVLSLLEEGADITEVAAERSIEPGAADSGGDLGCAAAANYVEPFAEAAATGEVGEFLGPVETQFGFHVIRVSSRDVASLDEAADQIRSQLEAAQAQGGDELIGGLLQTLVADSEVSISSRYGSWDESVGQVIRPEGPQGEAGTVSFG